MKLNTLFNKIAIAGIVVMSAAGAHAQDLGQIPGSHVGNGGGGIKRDGSYLTFGSAGNYAKLKPLTANVIPSLAYLQSSLRMGPFRTIVASQISAALLPSSKRKYYAVQESNLKPGLLDEVRKIYLSEVKAVAADELAVFAVTVDSETYLLPSFFELKTDPERAAILFHEALWVLSNTKQIADHSQGAPKPLTYNQVIHAEMLFQKVLEEDYSSIELFELMGNYFRDPLGGDNKIETTLLPAARFDMLSGRFKKVFPTLRDLWKDGIPGERICLDRGKVLEASGGKGKRLRVVIPNDDTLGCLDLMVGVYPELLTFSVLRELVAEQIKADKGRDSVETFAVVMADLASDDVLKEVGRAKWVLWADSFEIDNIGVESRSNTFTLVMYRPLVPFWSDDQSKPNDFKTKNRLLIDVLKIP